MSTLEEIEAAITALPSQQVEALTVWLEQRRLPPSAQPDNLVPPASPNRSIRDFFGSFATGEPHGADNERIDADLAREAAGGS